MALFDVPGWSIPDDPVAVTPKKRKRPSKHEPNKIRSATVNVEKLMEQLGARHELQDGKNGGLSTEGDRTPRKKRRRAEGNKSQQSPTRTAAQQVGTNGTSKKKPSGDRVPGSQSPSSSHLLRPESRSTLTSLQHGMKQSLDGARFRYVIHPNSYVGDSRPCTLKPRRWINEKLYKSDSTHAHAMMREDPAVFDDVRSPCIYLPIVTYANP
jgi:ribosomal RNA-processing protein 8